MTQLFQATAGQVCVRALQKRCFSRDLNVDRLTPTAP
jgi:hypothetical protein